MARPRELLGQKNVMWFFRSRRQEPPAMSLEGVLGPNDRLDEAEGIKLEAPEALCICPHGRLLVSSGASVLALDAWGREPAIWARFDAPVSALCAGPADLVAVALADGRLAVLDPDGQAVEGWSLPEGRVASIVDCGFRSRDELGLVVCG